MSATLQLTRLFSAPNLNGSLPTAPAFRPGSHQISYLASDERDLHSLHLYLVDPTTGQRQLLLAADRLASNSANMSAAERAERERRRFFASGITHHSWHPDGNRLLLVADGALYLLQPDSGGLLAVTPAGTRQTDARFSPTGRYLAYVRAGDLYLYQPADNSTRRLTTDASETLSYGIADFIAQEEMHQFQGYWFSPDERYLAYLQVDTSTIPLTHRFEFNADQLQLFPQRYPYTGGPNANVNLLLLDLTSGECRSVPWQLQPDGYLARVDISADALWLQVQSRNQQQLWLRQFSLQDLSCNNLLQESHHSWLNLHDNLRVLSDNQRFLWSTEAAGNRQLQLHNPGQPPLVLTPPNSRVGRVLYADDKRALFLGWLDTPLEQHLYAVEYAAPTELQQLTPTPGWHEVSTNSSGTAFISRFSSLTQPPTLLHGAMQPSDWRALDDNQMGETHPYFPYLASHAPATMGEIPAADGQPLYYRLTKPADFDPQRRYPVLVHVYGGPGVQRVRNDWQPLPLQFFARQGFVIFELDNRGSGYRAKRFEDPIYRRLGQVEVADQLAGVRFLQQFAWVDAERIGIYGHSYGGYMALMCLCLAPAVFRAGIAVAPVTDWRLYDTHYTERFLETPAINPQGYADSAVISHLHQLQGKLLLIHGMADDNVLFTHSTLLIKALQDAGKPFELMAYPGAKHALQERTVALHRYQLMLDFLQRQLQ